MVSFVSESESRVSSLHPSFMPEGPETLESVEKETPEAKALEFADSETDPEVKTVEFADSMTNPEAETLEYVDFTTNPDVETLKFGYEKDLDTENLVYGFKQEGDPWPMTMNMKKKKKKNQVFLEGYVETADEDDLMRTKSLTDDDLDELKGCLDLGFGFSYEEIPELCNTLPALELCYSMSQKFLDEQQKSPETPTASETEICSSASGPIANWKISSPGDHPEDVKARLKYWAQAVACTVRLCS